jgi:hypothetical protein
MTSTNDKITALRETLAELVGEWETDGSHPMNYERKNGIGEVVAEVNRWCGGYQNCHEPATIGWKTRLCGSGQSDIVLVADYADTDEAIEAAKEIADRSLTRLKERGAL